MINGKHRAANRPFACKTEEKENPVSEPMGISRGRLPLFIPVADWFFPVNTRANPDVLVLLVYGLFLAGRTTLAWHTKLQAYRDGG